MTRFWRLVVDFILEFIAKYSAGRQHRQVDVDSGAAAQLRDQLEEDARAAARARVEAQELKEATDAELRRRGDRWAGA